MGTVYGSPLGIAGRVRGGAGLLSLSLLIAIGYTGRKEGDSFYKEMVDRWSGRRAQSLRRALETRADTFTSSLRLDNGERPENDEQLRCMPYTSMTSISPRSSSSPSALAAP